MWHYDEGICNQVCDSESRIWSIFCSLFTGFFAALCHLLLLAAIMKPNLDSFFLSIILIIDNITS